MSTFFLLYQMFWELMTILLRQKHLNNIEQALQVVVSSKQCIWKSWLFFVALSGHMLDLQLYRIKKRLFSTKAGGTDPTQLVSNEESSLMLVKNNEHGAFWMQTRKLTSHDLCLFPVGFQLNFIMILIHWSPHKINIF